MNTNNPTINLFHAYEYVLFQVVNWELKVTVSIYICSTGKGKLFLIFFYHNCISVDLLAELSV